MGTALGLPGVDAARSELLTLAASRNSSEPAPAVPALLHRMKLVDLVLIEGFKRDPHPKIEVFRWANGKPPLYPDDPTVVAVAADGPIEGLKVPLLNLDDIKGVADIVQACALPVDDILWSASG